MAASQMKEELVSIRVRCRATAIQNVVDQGLMTLFYPQTLRWQAMKVHVIVHTILPHPNLATPDKNT
jgi:hypothetical protein